MDEGLVVIRTMGGIDGYVELTPQGAEKAEELILATAGGGSREPAVESTPADYEAWVARYEPMVSLAFQSFLQDDEWPNLDALQRALDRAGRDINVRSALQELPREDGEARAAFPTNFHLPLRALRYLREAEPVLQGCVDLVQRAVEIYLSDAGELRLTSDDSSLRIAALGSGHDREDRL
jgi:hypothetical protein